MSSLLKKDPGGVGEDHDGEELAPQEEGQCLCCTTSSDIDAVAHLTAIDAARNSLLLKKDPESPESGFHNEQELAIVQETDYKNHEVVTKHAIRQNGAIPFLDMVRTVVEKKSNIPFATWYNSKGNATNEYTFGSLWEEAGTISHYVRNTWGAKKGDRVLLCYDFGLHFFASFLGCLRAGVVAVLVYPPDPPFAKSLSKMAKVVENCKPVMILTDSRVNFLRKLDMKNPLSKSRSMWPKNVSWKKTDDIPSRKIFDEEALSDNDLAFLQYTSGSTGDPKGVMVTFSALVADVKLIHNGFIKAYNEDRGLPSEVVGFSWLPPYHDLGLIYAGIAPLAAGWRMHMMSPITFMKDPILWLELMSRLKVSWGVAPDFACHMVARKFKEARLEKGVRNPIPNLDLSSIHALHIGAEPIRLGTWQLFNELFAEYNLRDNWLGAGYGLAENVVCVCWIHEFHQSVPRDEDNGPYVAIGARQNFDSCITIKIIDQESLLEVSDGETGELWISGNSVARGYYGREELTEEVFHASIAGDASGQRFLRTGDLAFFQDDYLYICGRAKDLIICNGVNYYPQDIEHVVQDLSPAIRPGCCAAFSTDESGGDGMLEIVFEIRRARQQDAQEVCKAVCSAVATNVGLLPSRVVAIKERTIPKTTSGKIQRRATRKKLQDNSLAILYDHQNDQADAPLGPTEHATYDLPSDLPTDHIPQFAIDAVRTVQADSAKLENCFRELRLDEIPDLVRAWVDVDKSTAALQAMCETTMNALVQNHPTFLQFVHLLERRPEWFLGEGAELLTEVVHCSFVLQWATDLLASDIVMLRGKLNADRAFQRSETEKLNPVSVPKDARFLVGGATTDQLFGILNIFLWMKLRSVERSVEWLERCICENEYIPQDLLSVNISEAVWLDCTRKNYENASVGHWLCIRVHDYQKEVKNDRVLVKFSQPIWTHIYTMWNIAIMSSFWEPRWTMAKLLIPCIVATKPELFMMNRTISLYLVVQRFWKKELDGGLEPPVFHPAATRALGALNKKWAYQQSFQAVLDWEDASSQPPKEPTRTWLMQFDNWNACVDLHRNTSSSFVELMVSSFGAKYDPDKTWEELGLSSMDTLRNSISESLGVMPPPNYFETYPTPSRLLSFVTEECHVSTRDNTGLVSPSLAMPGKPVSTKMGEQEGSTLREQEEVFDEMLCTVLGEVGTANKRSSWDEIGLSSILSIHLRNNISERFSLSLPPDCFDRFNTPDELKSYVLSNVGCPFTTKQPKLETFKTMQLSLIATGLLQAIGIVLLLLLFALPIIPAWWAGQLVSGVGTVFAFGGRLIKWIWIPLVIPVWMLSFTLVVIVTKWIVVGKYREGEMRTPSIAYLRWWYVDRMMHLWEFWVGRFMQDTPLLPFVYIVLGAKVHPAVQLKAFIREFDLVQIGVGAVIEYKIGCRFFAPWKGRQIGPTIKFRSISIGKNCTVRGFLSPGVVVGEGACVDSLSVVVEGAQVPNKALARGNPAHNGGSVEPQTENCSWWQLGVLKVFWLVVELYIFFGLLLIGQLMLNDQLPSDWRYTPLCYWFLLIAQCSVLSILVSLALKWLLIGKRQPGPFQNTLWRIFSDWATDYHYQVGIMVLFSVTSYSRLWNLILKCFGMEINIKSLVAAVSILPSKVDLICINNSFVSFVTFDTDENKKHQRIKVANGSSVGRNARVGPGLTISGANVPPLTDVTSNIVQEQRTHDEEPSYARQESWVGLFSLMYIFGIFISLIPSYEIWILVRPSNVYVAVPTLATALFLATVSAFLLLRLVQHASYISPTTDRVDEWPVALLLVTITAMNSAELWTFLPLLWGTPMFNVYARLFGATVEGRLLYLGYRFSNPAYVTFADGTVVDDSVVNGHYAMCNKMVLGPCKVSGILHPGTYAMANTVVTNNESGPLRALVPTGAEFSETFVDNNHNQINSVNFTGNQDESGENMVSCV